MAVSCALIGLGGGAILETKGDPTPQDLRDDRQSAYDSGFEHGKRAGVHEHLKAIEAAKKAQVFLLNDVVYRTNPHTVPVGGWDYTEEYKAFRINATKPFVLNYTFDHISGVRLDYIVMKEAEYGKYLNHSKFAMHMGCTDLDAGSTNRVCKLPEGVWYLVIDNSVMGRTEPQHSTASEVKLAWTIRAWCP